jgi:predicted nucleic acid-binding protein
MGETKRHGTMILLDVNIFIDVLEGRDGLETSLKVMELVKENKLQGCISALTVPIIWFLIEKHMPEAQAKLETSSITKGFSVVQLSNAILQSAFKSEIDDFEDAIQLSSALKARAEFLITRNKKDFGSPSRVKILTPEEFLSRRRN